MALLENRAGTANSALEDAARFRIGEDAPATTVGDEATGWSNDRAADEGVTSLELTMAGVGVETAAETGAGVKDTAEKEEGVAMAGGAKEG